MYYYTFQEHLKRFGNKIKTELQIDDMDLISLIKTRNLILKENNNYGQNHFKFSQGLCLDLDLLYGVHIKMLINHSNRSYKKRGNFNVN